MLSPDELIKAKREQNEKEKQEEYLRYQAKQKAKAEERARLNQIEQILRRYPTLAKNVKKETESIPCFDGMTGLLFQTADFTNKNAWYIGVVREYSSITPTFGSEMQKEYERKMMCQVHSCKDYASCYIDETGQCWVEIDYYSKRDRFYKKVYYPVDTKDMARALWNDGHYYYSIKSYDWRQKAKITDYIPDEQLIDEYFKYNLLNQVFIAITKLAP